MSILINRFYREITAAGGGVNAQTPLMRGLIKQIIIKADTSTTVFDCYVSDGSSLHLFERESIDGEVNERVEIPVQSPLSIIVSASTRDELYKVYLGVQEA